MINFNFIYCCFIVFNSIIGLRCQEVVIESIALLSVDEVTVLKTLFSELKEIKSAIQNLSARLDDYQDDKISRNKDLPIFDIRFDALPEKCKSNQIPTNCAEATSCTHRSGIYKIQVQKYSNQPFLVECDVKTDDGDWLVIQRRQDGSVDFFRDWADYKTGFGNIDGEFFIGLDKLYALTNYMGPQELIIVMEDGGIRKYAKYSTFVIGNETDMYALQQLGVYSGDAGDSLAHHLGGKFSTKDRDNDEYTDNCALIYTGAWWHKKCHVSNLNGKYGDNAYAKGITWHSFRGYNASIKYIKMMIRRRRN